jgi:hypothetical protein
MLLAVLLLLPPDRVLFIPTRSLYPLQALTTTIEQVLNASAPAADPKCLDNNEEA